MLDFVLFFCFIEGFTFFVTVQLTKLLMRLQFLEILFSTSKHGRHDLYKQVNCAKKTCMLHFRSPLRVWLDSF